MKLNPKEILFGNDDDRKDPVLLAVTPPRTGERTLLGVENLLQSIAVPEPFSLELTGDMDGVTLMARCLDDRVVRAQLSAHYPQARIQKVDAEDDPLRLEEGEQAWAVTLRADGPEYVPLRTFRDDDLLDPGSDPLIALMGALSALYEGERVVARLMLRSLGPDWSQPHMEKAHKRPGMEPKEPAYTYQTKPLQMDGVTMAVLGLGALAALKGYLWVQDGETWKAAALGTVTALGLAVGSWAWWRWKKARSRVEDPILIQEKVSRIAFDAELQIVAVLPADTGQQRARELLGPVTAAYRHYDNPAGARFKVSRVRPVVPDAQTLHPPGPGLFGKRSVLGVREIAALWHPPGAGDETPLVERSGARALSPSAKGTRGGALVGDTTAGAKREIRFPDDLLRRHHLYVARTRMGKSTLMHHLVTHKLREKAAGRDNDAIVVIDPHTDLAAGILQHVPESLVDRVRLIDLSDETRAPGINLLDTRIFSDRDRTADSVVRVAKGLWEQWGPRMQSILEQTVKTLHEANEQVEAEQQYTILDGLKLLSDEPFRKEVLKKVSDPYLLEWWARDFGSWHRQYKAEALAPVQTRLSYYASSKRARAILGQRRSTIDMRRVIHEGGVLLVSTSQGTVGQGRGRPGGRVDPQPRRRRHPGAGKRVAEQAPGRPGRRRRDAVDARRGLRVDALGARQVRGQLHPGHPEPRQARRPLPHHARHPAGQRGLPRRLPGGGQRRPDPGLGAGQGPGNRGRHRVAPRPPLLRPRHRGQGANARLLDDGQKAGGGRPRRRRPRSRGDVRIHRLGPPGGLRGRRRPQEGGRLPQGHQRTSRRAAPRKGKRNRTRKAGSRPESPRRPLRRPGKMRPAKPLGRTSRRRPKNETRRM